MLGQQRFVMYIPPKQVFALLECGLDFFLGDRIWASSSIPVLEGKIVYS